MLSGCKLLKHKILIGILYGCGLRCMEVRNLRLCDLDFDRKQLKVVQGKGKKDRYVPLGSALPSILKKYIALTTILDGFRPQIIPSKPPT